MKTSFGVVSLLACTAIVCAAAGSRNILSNVFGDNMVLQAAPNSAVLFGEGAAPGSRVPVFLDGVLAAEGNADAEGRWTARLAPVEASDTQHVVRVGAQELRGVLFGDVYVCAGRRMRSAAETSVGARLDTTRVRALRVTAAAAAPHVWVPVGFAADDACLALGVRASAQSGRPVGLVQAVHDAPLAAWVPLTAPGVQVADDLACSACEYTQAAWDAVLSRIAPMRFRSFVWVGDGFNNNDGENGNRNKNINDEDNKRCVASQCVHAQLAAGVRGAFATNNLRVRTLRDDPFVVIGHRGMPSACPENTIVSQEVARRAGTVWIEDDTQPSKDGVPFVIHDATVDRTTDGTGAVRNLTAKELKALDAGSWFHPVFAGTRLPTLAEQLADLQTRGGNLLLEIKGAHSYREVQDIIALIDRYNMSQRVMIQSFDRPSLEHSYQIAPHIPRGLLLGSIEADPVASCKQLHLAGYNPDYKALLARPEVVAQLHSIGVTTFVWTPDAPDVWATLMKLGVDGVITNKATQLQGWVAAVRQQRHALAAPGTLSDALVDTPDAPEVLEGADARIVVVTADRGTAPRLHSTIRNFVAVPRGADLVDAVLN